MENVIDTYLKILKLKDIYRSGWIEVGIPQEKVESIFDHIGGVFCLAFLLKESNMVDFSKYDFDKIFKMVLLSECTKVSMLNDGENTPNATRLSGEDKINNLTNLFGKFENFSELMDAYNEFIARETKEAKFTLMLLKTEENLQALKYAKDGLFTRENALKDFDDFKDDVKNSIGKFDNTVGGWVGYNMSYMDSDLEPELVDINEEIRVSK